MDKWDDPEYAEIRKQCEEFASSLTAKESAHMKKLYNLFKAEVIIADKEGWTINPKWAFNFYQSHGIPVELIPGMVNKVLYE